MAENNGYSLRMRQLPKPEYKLMKALVKRYALKDDSELFQIALVLMYEVSLYTERGHLDKGEQWIEQVIDSTRSLTEKDRQYQLEEPA